MKIQNFCCIGAELQQKVTQSTKMSQLYYYRAFEEENLEEMNTSGFFNQADDRVKKDDIIALYSPNEPSGTPMMAWVKVVSNSGGTVVTAPIIIDSELYKDVIKKVDKINTGTETRVYTHTGAIQGDLGIDQTPTLGSFNLSTSGGIKLEVDNIYHREKSKLTGLVINAFVEPITMIPDGSGLAIPNIQIIFNKDVYYGNKIEDFEEVSIASFDAILPDMGAGTQKAFYFYLSIDGSPIFNEMLPVGSLGADRCYMGSGFAIKTAGIWKIQENSWKNQPWIPDISMETRIDPLTYTHNVGWTPYSNTQMTLKEFKIIGEGFNYVSDRNNPNTLIVAEKSPCMFKSIYPLYSVNALETSNFSTLNKWYNTDTQSLENVPVGKYSIVVPFTTPSTQIVFLIQQGTNAKPGYFEDLTSALEGIQNLVYSFENISSRIMTLGMSWIVISGLSDVNVDSQLYLYNGIPAQLQDYGSATSGGGSSPTLTGLTAFDELGIQIGATGIISETQASSGIVLSVDGPRLRIASNGAGDTLATRNMGMGVINSIENAITIVGNILTVKNGIQVVEHLGVDPTTNRFLNPIYTLPTLQTVNIGIITQPLYAVIELGAGYRGTVNWIETKSLFVQDKEPINPTLGMRWFDTKNNLVFRNISEVNGVANWVSSRDIAIVARLLPNGTNGVIIEEYRQFVALDRDAKNLTDDGRQNIYQQYRGYNQHFDNLVRPGMYRTTISPNVNCNHPFVSATEGDWIIEVTVVGYIIIQTAYSGSSATGKYPDIFRRRSTTPDVWDNWYVVGGEMGKVNKPVYTTRATRTSGTTYTETRGGQLIISPGATGRTFSINIGGLSYSFNSVVVSGVDSNTITTGYFPIPKGQPYTTTHSNCTVWFVADSNTL